MMTLLALLSMFDVGYYNSVYALGLQAKHNISESGIDAIIESTSVLMENHIETYLDQIKDKLLGRGIDTSVIDDVSFDHELRDFCTSNKRMSRYRSKLNYVKPTEVYLGKYYRTRNAQILEKKRVGYIIRLQDSLQSLLQMPEVWQQVNSCHDSSDEFMRDMCDGDYVRSHPIFARNRKALQLVVNTDDLEVVNPLGSHVKKHKVTMFYYSIANIRPDYRSRLHVIQLLAVAKTKDLRANDCKCERLLLQDFIDTVNKLSGGGIEMVLHGSKQLVEGALVAVCADTLAAQWIGGFKEGVSFAEKFCRSCEISKKDLGKSFVEDQSLQRDLSVHLDRCEHLETLSKAARVYWSKMWGINDASCLLALNEFPLTDGLLHDPMHVLLEGIVPHDLMHMLNCFIYIDKFFSLSFLNTAIAGFRYSYLHAGSKPEQIERNQLCGDGRVKQTASAMLTLIQVLPLAVGYCIPKENRMWTNFMRLLQIVFLCTTPYCTRETASLLRIMLVLYLQEFRNIYPKASFLPKMHYATHFPSQMLAFGPLRHHWCMRFEGKNGFFKLKKYRNFKNVPLSMAKHHQLHLCHKQAASNGGRSTSYLYEGDVVKEGISLPFSARYPQLQEQLEVVVGEVVADAYFSDSVSIHGLEYHIGCAVVREYDAADYPTFGIIRDVVVVKQNKYFVFERMSTQRFEQHILSYVIVGTGRFELISFYQLNFTWLTPMRVKWWSKTHVVTLVRPFSCVHHHYRFNVRFSILARVGWFPLINPFHSALSYALHTSTNFSTTILPTLPQPITSLFFLIICLATLNTAPFLSSTSNISPNFFISTSCALDTSPNNTFGFIIPPLLLFNVYQVK